jgi:hypothetical protein
MVRVGAVVIHRQKATSSPSTAATVYPRTARNDAVATSITVLLFSSND